MATSTAASTLTEFKKASSGNNSTFATIKIRYTGSWREDILQISNITGVPVSTIIQLNPWLTSNNFVANDNQYVAIKLTGGSSSIGGGSNNQNSVSGFYSTDEWVHPLGVGTWYCSQVYKPSHTGIDFTTGQPGQIQGKPIYASKAGTVVQSYSSTTWGYTVLVRHDGTKDSSGNCYYTRYAHMEALGPSVGTRVSQGDRVGTVGNTGKSTGYHLHFHIYWTSATRTDYTNFNGHADFGVNPNTIPNFPGIPYKEGQYFTIEVHKNPYVTDDDVKVIQGAAAGDGSVTEKQFNDTVNGIAERIIAEKGIDPNSDIANVIRDFVKAQLEGIKSNASDYASQLVTTGDFEGVFKKFCQDVVDQSIWFVRNKVNALIDYAIQVGKDAAKSQIDSAKSQLKSWIFNTTNTDPDSDLAKSVGTYLDGYIDTIVAQGWQAVTVAISTGDVKQAASNFVESVKRSSIDYACMLGAHAVANAITSYIGSSGASSEAGQVAADLTTGSVNIIAQAIGSYLKGDITFAQAAKNVGVGLVQIVSSRVVTKYVTPVVTKWVVSGITTIATNLAGEQIGGAIGGAIAGPVGYVIGATISAGLSWLISKAFGS